MCCCGRRSGRSLACSLARWISACRSRAAPLRRASGAPDRVARAERRSHARVRPATGLALRRCSKRDPEPRPGRRAASRTTARTRKGRSAAEPAGTRCASWRRWGGPQEPRPLDLSGVLPADLSQLARTPAALLARLDCGKSHSGRKDFVFLAGAQRRVAVRPAKLSLPGPCAPPCARFRTTSRVDFRIGIDVVGKQAPRRSSSARAGTRRSLKAGATARSVPTLRSSEFAHGRSTGRVALLAAPFASPAQRVCWLELPQRASSTRARTISPARTSTRTPRRSDALAVGCSMRIVCVPGVHGQIS